MTPEHPFQRISAWLDRRIEEAEFERDHQPSGIPPERQMGHRVAHTPKLDLREYLVDEPQNIEVPTSVHRKSTRGLGMLLNDSLGDCGEAMMIHGIEMFHRDAGTPVPPFADIDAQNAYSLIGGYVPGDPSTDQGTDNNVLVEKWKNPGITCQADNGVHTIENSVFVDPTDPQLTKLAIWEFVVCFRAYGLPETAEQQTHWQEDDSAPPAQQEVGSWGYHDIPLTSYGPKNVGLITWGEPWMATWPFDVRYSVQGFVVVTKEQTNLQGVSPAGVDWTKLNSDIGKLPADPSSH